MKIIAIKTIVFWGFFIFILSSCSQSKTNKEIILPQTISSNIAIDTINQDTALLQLKFTTGIRSILEDNKGNFWFGSHSEGLALYDGKELKYFTINDGLSDNQIRSIYEDATGMVWFEGGTGISNFDGKKINKFFIRNYESKHNWKAHKNDLWFKGNESTSYNKKEAQAGVYRYDGYQFNFHTFPFPILSNDFAYYSVSTPFARGKDNQVWFGTYGAVIGYNGSNFTIINNTSLGFNEETGYLHIRSIYEDSRGRLWIGNNGIGVLLYNNNKTINFSDVHGLLSENSLKTGGFRSPKGSLEHVFAIGEDNKGNIWFGDRDTGAWKFDGKSIKNYNQKDGLTTTHIWQIYRTSKDELWFAMGDGNVLKFNGESFEKIF